MFKRRLLARSILLSQTCIISLSVAASEDLPEVEVEGVRWPLTVNHTAKGSDLNVADSAEALKALPGAAVNRNGGLTGLVQYRGLYGDRINVSIDNASIVTGGPNAMDSPLSYIPASLLNSLEVTRGAASVSQGQETLGGHIEARSQQGEFGSSRDFTLSARLHSNWTSHNQGTSSSLQATAANNIHKLGINTSIDEADDAQFDDGKDLDSTAYQRRRHDIFYGYQQGDTRLDLKIGKNNTGASGTPALAMDITAIDSDLASLNLNTKLGDVKILWNSSYSHVFHAMNNFSERPLANPMVGPRETHAGGQQINHKLMASIPFENGSLRIGADYSSSLHYADVINPDSSLIIKNFNDAKRDISGVFGEWEQQVGDWSWEIGVRQNRVEMDSDFVSATGFPSGGMMNMMANTLATKFNSGDQSETYNNQDLVLKTAYQLNDEITFNASLSSKQRAPSYQERFLWLPMQSTGGLADGHTYIGNLNLDSETANEINLGFDFSPAYRNQPSLTHLSLQTFYREVDDYIQGTPYQASGNMMVDNAINGVANMMSGGKPALQYNNIDAKLYGAELAYRMTLNNNWSVDGSLSIVRGKRTDQSDDLYRIAPFNHRLSLNYQYNQLSVNLISELFKAQKHVSSYNSEESSAGYGLLHLQSRYDINDDLQLRAGISNLTDKRYQDHLSGYNRVSGNSDIAVGERLYGTGRSLNLGLTYQW